MDKIHVQPSYLIIFVPLAMVISVPVRLLIKRYNCVFPHNLFMGAFGACIGGVMIFVHGKDFVGISNVPPEIMVSTFMPIYIVSILYRIDFNIFKRSLPQCLMITITKVVMHILLLGTLFKFILESSWSYVLSILAALACVSVQPSNIILMFKELARYKFLGTILETESILGSIPNFILFDIFIRNQNKALAWYNVLQYVVWYGIGGFIVGCILGKLTAMIMCWIYNKPQGSLCVFIGSTFFSYFLCQYILHVSSCLAVVCLVCFIVNSKHMFSTEVDICIDSFWQILYYIADNCANLILTCEMVKFIYTHCSLKDMYDIIIIYFCSNILRLMFFQVVRFPMMKMAYNIDIKCSLVLGWSGVKGSVNLMCALLVYYHCTDREVDAVKHFLTDMTIYSYLTLLINSSSMRVVLRLTGLSELSSARRSNMNNCMRFVMDKRYSVINMLKLNRYLSDANWSIVINETIMKHPYRIKIADDISDDEEDETLWNTSSAICPICFKEVSFDMTERELLEVLKEAQIKIIKAKKVSIIKQYETGIINRNSLDVLIHLFEIMMESSQEDNTVDLSKYLKANKFLIFVSKVIEKLDSRKMIGPPMGGQFHKLCYYLMMHVVYDYIIFGFNMIYFCINIYFLWIYVFDGYYIAAVVVLNVIFIFDFFVKMFGYASNCTIAFQIYIMLYWNIFDLILLIIGFADIILLIIYTSTYYISFIYLSIKIIGLLHCFKILYILQIVYKKLIKMIEKRSDTQCAAGFDLATALVNCSDEIIDLIMQLIEVHKIREIYMKKIHKERISLIKMMDTVQKLRPWVAITMKTKQVIRIVLNSMEESLNQLKFSGFVDNIEYSTIYKEIYEKQKFLRNLEYVQPLPPKIIFTEVPWMVNDAATLDFLYHNVHIRQWDVGDVICKSGKGIPGIMIVVTGLLKLSYNPKQITIDRYDKIGHLPIVDYMASLDISKPYDDNIMSGFSIGELSLLTGRPYDCDITAEVPGQAYVLTTDKVREAMKLKDDPVNGLESRLWKHATQNIVISTLAQSPTYESWSYDQIKLKLRRSFIPILRCYKMFIVIPEIMEDIILIEGIAADYDTGDIFISPLLIPKTNTKIVFPRNDVFEIECPQSILLIMPAGDISPYYIMECEEEIAELVSLASSSCLLHIGKAQQKKSKSKKRISHHRKQAMLFVQSDLEANMFETLQKNLMDAKEREQVRLNLIKRNDVSTTSLQ